MSLTRLDDCACEGAPDGSSIKCLVCDRPDLVVSSGTAEYEICTVCGWQHDHVCEGSPDVRPLGPNKVSFNEARANFAQYGESHS